MRTRIFIKWALPFVYVGLWISCRYNKEKVELVCTPPEQVSFNRDVLPVLVNNCAGSGCHSGKTPEGNFNLEASVAFESLSKKGSGYIDTITPRYSVLYSSMASISNPMPPTGRLDKCKIDIVEKWMLQKAKNN